MATTVVERKTLQPRVTQELLDEIVRRIVESFGPHKILLFGSHADGTPREDSDIDLFVIMDSNLTPPQRSAQVLLTCHPGLVPMDLIVRTPAEVEQRLAMGDFFIEEIMKKGKVLYDDTRRVDRKGRG